MNFCPCLKSVVLNFLSQLCYTKTMEFRELDFVNPQAKSRNFVGAMLPTPLVMGDYARIYFTSRDKMGRGHIFFVDFSPKSNKPISQVSETFVLAPGQPGTFDDNGVAASSAILIGTEIFLFYVGFEIPQQIRYRMFTGLAIANKDEVSFTRYSNTPILDRVDGEELFRCGPFLNRVEDGFEMYYVAGNSWIEIEKKQYPVYSIKSIFSDSLFAWSNKSTTSISFDPKTEHGIARPWLRTLENGNTQLLYSVRDITHKSYLAGYAERTKDDVWQRMDEHITFTEVLESKRHPSRRIMYQAVIELCGKIYAFYNGDDFGVSGFYIAEVIDN